MSELATLKIVVDASGAIRAVDGFGKTVGEATKKADGLSASAKRVGLSLGTTLAAGLALVVKNTAEADKVQAQLEAAIRSTGSAAGQTIESLNAHSAALQRTTAFGDEATGSAQALLLTFTKIGRDVFPQATETVLDMATALGTDATSAAMQLGKALNDPVVGVTALGRAGVQFSASQKAIIENFVNTNQLAKAQQMILAELQTQVGGSAAAYRNTLGGALEAVKTSFGDLFEVSSPGMQGLVEEINLVADSIAQIPTLLQMAATGTQSFLNKALIAALEFNQRGRPSQMLDNARARQTQYDTDASALAALLGQQRQAAIDAFVARANAPRTARSLSPSGGGTSGAPVDPAQESIKQLQSEIAQLNPMFVGMTGSAEELSAILAILREATNNAGAALETRFLRTEEERKQAAAILPLLEGENRERKNAVNLVTELGDATGALTESARVFLEQTQVTVGRFASDFLKDGFSSFGRFWEDFKQLGRDAIGNIFAKNVMDRLASGLGDTIKSALDRAGLGGAGGVGVAAFGLGIVSSMQAAAAQANAIKEAMADSARSIAQFARLATDGALTPEQRSLKDLLDQRDALARAAVKASGINGFTGGFDEAVETARTFSRYGIDRARYAELLRQLEELGKAHLANVDAIKKNMVALENQRKAEEYAARQRQAAALEAFRDGLNLSTQSPLSPTAQLAEARRQYEVILALAKAGDASAISSLPETARTLLDASRAVNASGVRYAQDFAKVQADTATIIESLRAQTQDDALDVTDTILERVDPYFTEAISLADAQLVAQQAGFQAVVGALDTVREEVRVMKMALKMSLEELAAAR